MTTILEQLDTLADFQAQRDLLELDKAALLNSVKVPAEVEAAQNEANRKRSQLDNAHFTIQRELSERARAEMEAVPMPELPIEYQQALDAAKAKRAEIQERVQNESEAANLQAHDTRAKIETELADKTAAIFAQVETRKREIADEFGVKASAVDANIAKLTDEIKQAVIAEGHSVKGKVFHAVYAAGRVTWNADRLDALAQVFPGIKEARKEGAPSVSIRKI